MHVLVAFAIALSMHIMTTAAHKLASRTLAAARRALPLLGQPSAAHSARPAGSLGPMVARAFTSLEYHPAPVASATITVGRVCAKDVLRRVQRVGA